MRRGVLLPAAVALVAVWIAAVALMGSQAGACGSADDALAGGLAGSVDRGGIQVPPGPGVLVGATMYGGPGDPTSGTTGSSGANLTGRMAFAELGTPSSAPAFATANKLGQAFGASQPLAYGSRLLVTFPNGRQLVLEKLDIGAGVTEVTGRLIGGKISAIDVWWEAAERAGMPGVRQGTWSGLVKVQRAAGPATSLAGGPEDAAACAARGDVDVRRSFVVRQPQRFQTLPAQLRTPGYADQCDARIVPDVIYLLRRYNLRAHDCRASGHQTHGDGLSIDIVPGEDQFPEVGDTSKMTAWKRLETGIRTLGWRPSCAGNGCIGANVPAIYAIFYNGFSNHGDPASYSGSCGCPHVHIRWSSQPPTGGVPSLAAPFSAVRVFTPPPTTRSSGA
jgi:hypothetical protein